ncbi:MAG: peptide chain release factor N(5)-glutamine methyltransferase [Burkholderiaceae bacterium]
MAGSAAAASINSALNAALDAGLDRLDAQLLLLHALGTPPVEAHARRAWLLAHGADPLAPEASQEFAFLRTRRLEGEPLAYITGHKEFFGLALQVDPRVLVPRPDTETLVLWALEVLTDAEATTMDDPLRVLDLGTGSGAIALALKFAMPLLRVHASDLSAAALDLARTNAHILGLDIGFSHGCWLEATRGTYHCILANPPYVAAGDPHLPALCHEPLSALVAGHDGLQDLRKIVTSASRHLCPGGWLLLEHGHNQAAAVLDLLARAGFDNLQLRRDLGGHERCTGGQFMAPPAGAGQW